MQADSVLLYCRAGFEGECAREISSIAAELNLGGFVKAKPLSGFAAFRAHEPGRIWELGRHLVFSRLMFARQAVRDAITVTGLTVGDRVTPIVAAAAALGTRFQALVLEMPDTNDGKALSTLIRPLAIHLERALAKAGIVFDDEEAEDRLHVFFVGGTACYVGLSDPRNSSPFPMGIPRLHLPRAAPSRSTLKLAEAIALFLGERETKYMAPGMTAIDLGASPGGWTYQLVQRHLSVIAVDNGPMDAALLETGLVKHRRLDAFHYEPSDSVDWMVCDLADKPSRVATLAAKWFANGWCRETIFNLKLPMKKRWEEVEICRGIITAALEGKPHLLRLRQLYHDREEITVHLAKPTRARRS